MSMLASAVSRTPIHPALDDEVVGDPHHQAALRHLECGEVQRNDHRDGGV